MELFPSDKIRATFQTSKWVALGLFIVWLLRETILHAFFSWFNDKLVQWIGHINIVSVIIKWTGDNPIQFLIILGVSYCLFIIIGAQLFPFYPLGMVPLKKASQRLYGQLRSDPDTVKYFDSLAAREAWEKGRDEELNLLGGHFAFNTSIDIYGRRHDFTNLEKIDKYLFNESVIKDGASALWRFGYREPEFIDLTIKKRDLRKAINEIIAYMRGAWK